MLRFLKYAEIPHIYEIVYFKYVLRFLKYAEIPHIYEIVYFKYVLRFLIYMKWYISNT